MSLVDVKPSEQGSFLKGPRHADRRNLRGLAYGYAAMAAVMAGFLAHSLATGGRQTAIVAAAALVYAGVRARGFWKASPRPKTLGPERRHG